MICPQCTGDGKANALVNRGQAGCDIELVMCWLCHGSGMISGATAIAINEGRRLRAERIARNESIREMAKRLGVSPAEISRQERGVPATGGAKSASDYISISAQRGSGG